MTQKLAAFAIILVLLVQRPHAQGSLARIYFVDIGTGAATLIVSPTGKTLLVDGGPPGGGTKDHSALLDTLGIAAIDYTVLTHYHIDHDRRHHRAVECGPRRGRHRLRQRRRRRRHAAGHLDLDRTALRGTYLNYVAARPAGVTRATIAPGQVIDLGGGMRATCIVAGGRLLSGGSVAITNEDLNTESISLLDRVQRLRLHRVRAT